jgi:hypothetical protein
MEIIAPTLNEIGSIVAVLVLVAFGILAAFCWRDDVSGSQPRNTKKAASKETFHVDSNLLDVLEQSLKQDCSAFEARKQMIEAALEASRHKNAEKYNTDISIE